MALLKTIEEVKKYIRISNYNEDASVPDMDAAAREHIIPYISLALYNELDSAYNADPQTLTPDQSALLPKIQSPLAAFAYYDNLAFINATITDRGITYVQTQEMPPVSRWSYLQLKESLKDLALVGIERMLEYLEQNADKFATWESSDERKAYKSLLIRDGDEFSGIYTLYQPRRTFIALKGTMAMVEEMYVESLIGKDFLASLKAPLTDPAEEESYLISLLKKGVAYMSIWHAIQALPVRISDNGFTVLGSGGAQDSPEQGRTAADGQLLEMKLQAAKREGDHYLVKAKKYLDDNASADLFADYFNSNYYTMPDDDDPDSGPYLENDKHKIFRL